MKKNFSREAKIGIVSIVSIGLLYFGINYLKGINLFKPVNHYYVSFDNVKDVTISTPVFVEGFKIGLVRSMSYDYSATDKIRVEIGLDDNMRIKKGSYVIIAKTLLGGAELHIRLNKYADEYLKPGETMEGRKEEDMMGAVQEKILPGIEALLPKLDSILTGLQTLVNHPALSQSLNHIERTTGALEASSRQLNSLLNNDVPVILSHLQTVSGNFVTVSNDLKNLDLVSTINSVNATLANLKLTTERLNSKDNSLGLLLNDKALYNSMNTAIEDASELLIDFRERPKRYLHFSIF
ncbi:MAG: mammalian cell entry protein [Bacteroidales bacterium]